LGELVWLQQQLAAVASSRVVTGAHRLTAEVAPVLEPVWSILARAETTIGGVGFLRRFGLEDARAEAAEINAAVAKQAVETYQSLELIAPSTREVWSALARPARALVESVRTAGQPAAAATLRSEPGAATLDPTLRAALPRELLGGWERESAVVPAMRRLLRRWCELARHATGERREVARLTLAAGLLARGAVLDGDTETVAWFIDRWLGQCASPTRVDGVSAALLEDGWTHPRVDDEFSTVRDAVTDLRIEAMYQHRLHRPVWETQIGGGPVVLLSEPSGSLRAGNGLVPVELADTLVDGAPAPEATAAQALLLEDLEWVLDTLSKRERKVALAFAQGRPKQETCAQLRISRHQLYRLEHRVLSKLRHPSRSQRLRDYL